MSYVQWLFEGLDYDQNKPIYIDANNPYRSLSAAQVKSLVLKIGAGLQKFGLEKGDCACVVSLNDIYYTPTYLGIIAAGGIFTGANPAYTVFEIAHHLRVCEAKFIIADPKSLTKVKEAAAEVGIPESNIIIFDAHHEEVPSGAKSLWGLIGEDEIVIEDIEDSANVPASYISSSGTSGLPKAVVIPHAYLVDQCLLQTERKMPYEVSRLICLPPFPAYAAPSQHGMPLKTGSPCYVMPRYDGNGVLDAVEKYRVTEVLLVPPMLLSLPLLPKCTSSAVASLRQVFCGGAAVTYHIQEQLYDILHPDARINQIYGMSECGWVCGFQYPEKDETGSVGRPFPGFTLKVVDDDGNDCLEDGQAGEIYIKPPFIMLGYRNNPSATTEAIAPSGWVRSGDVGYVKDSKWYVPDRKKDVIKVKGWQVSPTELEGVLLLHDDIIDAGVISHQSANTFDGVPRAFVVRRPGSTITEDDVKVWMSERLVRYKQVDRIIFVTEIPRNPTGKILRRLLKDGQYTEEVAVFVPVEQVVIPEAVVDNVLITGDGRSSPAASYKQIAAPEVVIVQEELVTGDRSLSPAASYKNIATPEVIIIQGGLVTGNGTSSPAATYEHLAAPEVLAQDVPVSENEYPSPAATYEHIASPEAVTQDFLVAENGSPSPPVTYEDIAMPEVIDERTLTTDNGCPSPPATYEDIAIPKIIKEKTPATENGCPSPPASYKDVAVPEIIDEKTLAAENEISISTLPGKEPERFC